MYIRCLTTNPFGAAVPFWGRTSQILSSRSPKRDCGPKRDDKDLIYDRGREGGSWRNTSRVNKQLLINNMPVRTYRWGEGQKNMHLGYLLYLPTSDVTLVI